MWVPFQLSTTGRGCYAIGSSASAAYMTGKIKIDGDLGQAMKLSQILG